jgi:hypothetical protein
VDKSVNEDAEEAPEAIRISSPIRQAQGEEILKSPHPEPVEG